jgi:hypothetical protein
MSAAEKIPGDAGFTVSRLSDMISFLSKVSASQQRAGLAGDHLTQGKADTSGNVIAAVRPSL